ncbi:hypothetical protein JCM19047_2898 [Bacillus sp. JCM 19047]|nr:hypothetical protein JCM19047_2898 [Bacillus sp. JCM 19047]
MPAADAYVTDGVDGALGVLEDMTGLKRTVFDDVSELQADFQKLMESETIDLDEYPAFMRERWLVPMRLGK